MGGLLIETSTERGMTAIVNEGLVLYQGVLPIGYQNSTNLLPAIETGLQRLSLRVADLDYIAVGIGPGSYTGIRVGVAAAKALAFACQLPLIGVCTLHTFLPKQAGKFAILIDAKIGGAYVVLGEKIQDKVTYLSEPAVLPLEQLGPYLECLPIVITPQQHPLQAKLQALFPENKWAWEESEPSALHMAGLAEKLKAQGQIALNGHLPLLYLRKTQAEMEKG